MTGREIDLYRWLETFSLASPTTINPDDINGRLAIERRYVELEKGSRILYVVADAGWEWFNVRTATIIGQCEDGRHQWRKKAPAAKERHCMWCGQCEQRPCAECAALFAKGTIEGGAKAPLWLPTDAATRANVGQGDGG